MYISVLAKLCLAVWSSKNRCTLGRIFLSCSIIRRTMYYNKPHPLGYDLDANCTLIHFQVFWKLTKRDENQQNILFTSGNLFKTKYGSFIRGIGELHKKSNNSFFQVPFSRNKEMLAGSFEELSCVIGQFYPPPYECIGRVLSGR